MHLFNADRLRLLITDSCNLSCSYCHNEGQFGRGRFMSMSFVAELAAWLQDNSIRVDNLILSGGEPSLHPQLTKIVETLNGTAKKISMVSNGTRLTPAVIDCLTESGLSYIKFGIDAVDALSTKGPLDRASRAAQQDVLANAAYAATVMPGSHLNSVVSAFNYHRIRKVVEWCDQNSMGVKFLELIEVRPEVHAIKPYADDAGHSWFARIYEDVGDLLTDVAYNPVVMKFYARSPAGQLVQFSENFCLYGACSRLWTRIDAHGNLVPCINRPVTRSFSRSEIGLNQSRAVNQEMKNVSAWPCGAMGITEQRMEPDRTEVDIALSDGSVVSFPLTGRTSCVG
ncbi:MULTISPECIES: radical SAM protein [unclassified Streptomyces]|uniref:radical SAM protein n=1 Tax=unclassified Streptomyces TaxID=2593676 RepID=UPI002E373A2A|nr:MULTISPECIES: radical SAM protein [unclassified Streptomyces]